MTNEEKALNLSQKYGAPKNKNREIAVYQSALEMAEWFKERLKMKRSNIYWNETSLIDRKTKLDLLDEIINEFFRE